MKVRWIVVLGLFGFFMLLVGATGVDSVEELEVKWTINKSDVFDGWTFGAGHLGCETVWDVDGDGVKELVFGSRKSGYGPASSRRLWCFDAYGSFEWIYPTLDLDPLPGDPTSKVSLVDVDGYGVYELCFAGRGGRLHVLNGDGTVRWTWVNPNSGDAANMHGAPQAFDIDGDGFVEFFMNDNAGFIYRVNHEGQLVWTSFQCGNENHARPTIADIDQDGEFEVLWVSRDHNLYCISATDGAFSWSFDTGADIRSNPVIVADVNKDGEYEALVWNDAGRIYCINPYGVQNWVWELPISGRIRICQAMGDVDEDGSVEMAIMSSVGMFCIDIGGAIPLTKWGIDQPAIDNWVNQGQIPEGAGVHQYSSYQLIVDIDGDDLLEILWEAPYPIVTDAATGMLEAYYWNEHLRAGFHPDAPGTYWRAENGGWWGDIDEDGVSEWIVELQGWTHEETQIYCLTLGGSYPAKASWPEYSHSALPPMYQRIQGLSLISAHSNSLWFPIGTDRITALVKNMPLNRGTKNSLVSKLDNAKRSLEKGNERAAVNKLKAFTNEVEAQKGKKIPEIQADLLIQEAQEIINSI